MGILTKAVGISCAAYAGYVGLIFTAFTLDLKRDIALLAPYPSINDHHHKPFNAAGLMQMLFWVIVWSLHHSIFARGWMAKIVSNVVTPALERSMYVFATSLLLDWMMFDEQIYFGGGIVWNLQSWNECNVFVRNALVFLGSVFFIAMFQLGGLRLIGIPQSFGWNTKNTRDATSPRLQHFDLVTDGFYNLVRHPLQTGVLFVLWCSPFMTLQKFVWALSLTIYIVIGIHLEEIECVKMFGDEYVQYQQRTPQLIPLLYFCPFGSKQKLF